MAGNALRAILSEIGIVAAQGIKGLRELMSKLDEPSAAIPELMRGALQMLARQWQALDEAERALERQIKRAAMADQDARRLMEVPCVGPIIASAVLAKVPDPRVFRSGRDFAAWIGLTARDRGTGGKSRLLQPAPAQSVCAIRHRSGSRLIPEWRNQPHDTGTSLSPRRAGSSQSCRRNTDSQRPACSLGTP